MTCSDLLSSDLSIIVGQECGLRSRTRMNLNMVAEK
jgi:hypothetical protein